MGRTLPTVTQLLETEKESWVHFRRTLRKEDQPAFDALWRWARRHTAPLSMAARPVPMEGIFLAMLLEIVKRLPAEPSDLWSAAGTRSPARVSPERVATHEDQRLDI